MANPFQTWLGLLTIICAVLPSIGTQAVILPAREAKMKLALAVGPTGGVTGKSGVVLKTVPVGSPPGIVIVCGLALRTTGEPETSPRTSCAVPVPGAVPVPLFAI